MFSKKTTALALSSAVALTALAPASGSATATESGRHTVKTEKLAVFKQPSTMYVGLLFKGETFVVKKLSSSGKYAYGKALGKANKSGWVLARSLDRS